MALTGQKLEEKQFEDEVIRVARWLYPNTEGDGSIMFNGKERDGVFVNQDDAVAIECTVSKGTGKAKDDGRKLDELCRYLAETYPDRAVRGYFITKQEPTGDQRSTIKDFENPTLAAISFDTFRSRLIKATDYLHVRSDAPFGSARNPADGSIVDLGEYLQMDFARVGSHDEMVDCSYIVQKMKANSRIVLTGDYGAGKSMTLREVFLQMRNLYRTGSETAFPIHLNLREHYGQTEPAEALERHARNIGYETPHHLVRAWRAGFAHIILDGFDEIAPPGIGGGFYEHEKKVRHASVELIRRFIHNTPSSCGVLIAGRGNYFYGTNDMTQALGCPDGSIVLSTTDFTESQLSAYLEKQGWSRSIPDWLPARPLLVGYLASQSILADVSADEMVDQSAGWDYLLDRIFERESMIENGIDAASLREIFERVATKARATSGGLGPIFFEDVRSAFREVMGYASDVAHDVLLRRLPLLAPDNPRTQSKKMVDDTVADVARAGDVIRYVFDPYSYELESKNWIQLLNDVGIGCASFLIEKACGGGLVPTALSHLIEGDIVAPPLAADLIALCIALEVPLRRKIILRDLDVPEIQLPSSLNLSLIEFQYCFVGRIEVRCPAEMMPLFTGCAIVEIDGIRSEAELPENFVNCEFDQFSVADDTNDSLLSLNLYPALLVGLVILRKLYSQQGSGRKESALRRGLPPTYYALVDAVIGVLTSAGLMVRSTRGRTAIWVPVKSQRQRVQALLDASSSQNWPDDEDIVDRLMQVKK